MGTHSPTYVQPDKIGEVSHSILWNNSPVESGTWDVGGNERIDPSTVPSASGADLSISTALPAALRETQFKYDLNSNLLTRELPNGVTESRTYDALNRLSSCTNSSLLSLCSLVANYAYDPVGNLREMTDSITGLHSIPEACIWSWEYDDSYRWFVG